MTSRNILVKFNHRFGSMHDLDANVLTTDEVTEAFNNSMLQLLSEYTKVYEVNELARMALQPLVKTSTLIEDTTPSNTTINSLSKVYTLPTDCFSVVLAQTGIHYSETPVSLAIQQISTMILTGTNGSMTITTIPPNPNVDMYFIDSITIIDPGNPANNRTIALDPGEALENVAEHFVINWSEYYETLGLTLSYTGATVSITGSLGVTFPEPTIYTQSGSLSMTCETVMYDVEAGFNIDDTILVKPITHDQYWKNINNPFKQPNREVAWRLNYIDGHEIIPDSTYVIDTYTIRYIKYPVLFNVITNAVVELNTKEIDIIVDMSVAKAFEFLINNGRVKGTLQTSAK